MTESSVPPSSPPGTRPVCVLIGPPGAGKTTIGQLLADALGVAFRDTDTDIENTTGRPIPEIFVDDGEPAFRALERTAVGAALASHAGVLALGGGAVMAEETRALLRGHTVVFLSVGVHDAVKRVGLDSSRPLLMMNPRATLRHLLEQRRPLYDEVATATVETDGREPSAITDDVLIVLKG